MPALPKPLSPPTFPLPSARASEPLDDPPQGLLAKSAKEGALPSVPLLLLPETHLHLAAAERASRSLWVSVRARGAAATAAFVAACAVACLWLRGDAVAAAFPGAEERVLGLVYSVPGGAVGLAALRLLSGAAGGVVRALNPFHGARDALRLPPFAVSMYAGTSLNFVRLPRSLRCDVVSSRLLAAEAALSLSVFFFFGKAVVSCAAPASR